MGRSFRDASKVRTLSGNYQLIQLAPWMITYSNPILLNFVSHKLFRLLVPFALLLMLTVGFSLSHLFYRATALSLVACALLGTVFSLSSRFGILARAGNLIFTFLVLNAAAALAFLNFVLGRTPAWRSEVRVCVPQVKRGR